ncbi:MAG TPA: low molecular weight protein arginine phosphatase [Candidatus Eisenbacteria bacterium]|nr:low molecular weight protein arginine phosphatase [Candidatus Eisenbacteria bacterium]
MSREPLYRVLVVCSGNTCRSPLVAAALAEALGADAERVEVLSAGTAAWEGQPASEGSVKVARQAGIDLTPHRSRRATPQLVRGADDVIVMDREHARAVQALGADPARTHVISEWPAPGEPDWPVSDPFGGSPEAYEECWRRIRRHVDRIVPHIRETLRARL